MKTINGNRLSELPDFDESYAKGNYTDVDRACSRFLRSRGISGSMYGLKYGSKTKGGQR